MRWSDKQGGRERLQTNVDRGRGELSGGHPAALAIAVGWASSDLGQFPIFIRISIRDPLPHQTVH